MNYKDIGAEQAIIGSLLSEPNCYNEVFDIVKPEDFYEPKLGEVFRIIGERYEARETLDIGTLAEKAKVHAAVLAECLEHGWFAAGVKGHARRVSNIAKKRDIHFRCSRILQELDTLEVTEAAAQLTDIATELVVADAKKKVLDVEGMTELVTRVQQERFAEPGVIRGIRTGYGPLDYILRGLRPKRMTLLVAPTGFGKSSLAINLFERTARSDDVPLLISNENDIIDNLDRVCGAVSGMELNDIESGRQHRKVIDTFKEKFREKKAYISDNSPRTIEEVVGTINRYVLRYGVKIAFVDYIGEVSLSQYDVKAQESEEARLARWGQRLVECAKALGIHLIVLAQLNREGNKKGRPSKTDLQGCFKLAQKSHSFLIFWQTECKQDVLTVEKNRQGPSGVDIAIKFERETQRITAQGFWDDSAKCIRPYAGQAVNDELSPY